MSSRRQTAAVFVGLLLLSLALYAPVLNDYFISDDFVLVRFVRTWDGSWLDFLLPWRIYSDPIVVSRYKPFFVYLLKAEDTLFGDGVVGRHLLNVLAHALAGTAVFALSRRLTNSAGTGVTAAVLFVGSRLHSQAVSWTSSLFHLASVTLIAWALVALHADSKRKALWWFGALTAAAMLTDPEVVVAAPVVVLLALHHRFGPGGDRQRAGTVAWGAGLMTLLAAACSAANWISLRHFPDEDFAFRPQVARFAYVFLDLFMPFAVPLPVKIAMLVGVVIACVLVARKEPLVGLFLLAAVPAGVLWSSIGSYGVSPRYLYLPALFTSVAMGRLVWLALGRRPWLVALPMVGLVVLSGVAMRDYDFVLLEGRSEVGARLHEEQLKARAAGEHRHIWVRPSPRLTAEDLRFFAPELDFVDGPEKGVEVIDSGEGEYVHRLGPGFANSYWPWVWFSSSSAQM